MDTLVIIGASNVTLSLPVIWSGLPAAEHRPRRLLVAAGHGRSFALPSTVLGRTLPSILECGLWSVLDATRQMPAAMSSATPAGPPGPTLSTTPGGSLQRRALITDVGNDLLYGASATQVAEWVRECVERLLACGILPRLTRLPLDSLRSLSRSRFLLFRRLLFPSSTLSFESAIEQAEQLDAALVELTVDAGLEKTVPQPHWYGLDPVHIRRQARPEAWQQFLAPLLTDFAPYHPGFPLRRRLWTRKAAVRWRGRREFVTPQPCLTDGSTELWLF